MPGLVVIISQKGKEKNQQDLARMLASMHHEPFYVSGTYANEALGLYVGWVSQPGVVCDAQPLQVADPRLRLFFYGHHLTDEDSRGGPPCECSDAHTVLRLFDEHGLEALQRLNGWFNGVLVDLQRREIIVFNDRYGMQRLYCHEESDVTLLATEAKALLAVRPHLRRFDPRGLGEFLSCGCVLENRSLFTGVGTMPAGSYCLFANGLKIGQRRYFVPENWESQSSLSGPEFHARLAEVLPRAVRRCLRSPLPVGISLTGGYDTRLILSCIDAGWPGLPTYTFGGMYRECFDVKIARQVAGICGREHHVLELGPSFLQGFPSLAETTVMISDGCLGATNAYELYLNRLARKVAAVRITGSFGSEVMRGMRAFKAISLSPGLIHQELAPQMNAAIRTFDSMGHGHSVSFSVFKQAPWHYYNRLAVEHSQVMVRTPYMDNDFVGLFYRRPANDKDGRTLARHLIAERAPALAALPTDTGNCSYLRHQWAQFLFKADYCYKSGMPQWLEQLHHWFGPLQPEKLLIGRHRFAHFRVWFRNQLAPYVKEILLDRRTAARAYFNPVFVERMVNDHIKGRRNYTDDIERILTVELASRKLLEN